MCENVACRYDVKMFISAESLALTPFCVEFGCKKKGYFNVLVEFSVQIWYESGKICNNSDMFVSLHEHLPGPSGDV